MTNQTKFLKSKSLFIGPMSLLLASLIAISFLACAEKNTTQASLLPTEDGLEQLNSEKDYQLLATSSSIAGSHHTLEVKFIIIAPNSKSPQIFFINTNKHTMHHDFVSNALGNPLSAAEFSSQTYFTKKRNFLAGEITYFSRYKDDSLGTELGVYAMGFWPSDPIPDSLVQLSYNLISEHAPFMAQKLKYLAKGLSQIEALSSNPNYPSIVIDELFKNFNYIPYNTAESYGTLRLSQQTQYTASDIAVFQTLPNKINHLSGYLTLQPQTPLSHINLIAKQNNTPNAYIQDILTNSKFLELDGQAVHLIISDTGYNIQKADPKKAGEYLEEFRPQYTQLEISNIFQDTIKHLDDIYFFESSAYGSKTANLAEVIKILPHNATPKGYAIPFSYYHKFMQDNHFFDTLTTLLSNTQFKEDPIYRKMRLKSFRNIIRKAPLTDTVKTAFSILQSKFSIGQSIRCRSSTNSEDLENFSGAGLYNSYTHHPEEGHLEKSIKQVWASLWTFRAFEEREFYRIKQNSASMAVLVHSNYSDELANGVAVAQNIYTPTWKGFYINSQVGEDLVTNPEKLSTPEELIVSQTGPDQSYETEIIRRSNLIEKNQRILNESQVKTLRNYLDYINSHFKELYKQKHNTQFAMEIEFKIDSNNLIQIKQARPWVQN
jgi:pyruvate, water dikinase